MNIQSVWKHENADKYIALFDQAFLSLINFGSILVLSKLAGIAVFSAFVVTYSYSVFLFLFSSLLLSSPILIFFSKKWKNSGAAYLLGVTILTCVINLIVSFGLFIFLEQQIPQVSFLLFFLLCLGISLFDVLKKFAFAVKGSLLKKALISTIILNFIFFGLLAVFQNSLELNKILMIYCLSFFTASLFIFFFIFNNKNFFFKPKEGLSFYRGYFKNILITHYKYAKWLLIGGVAYWGYTQGIFILAKYYEMSDTTIGMVRTIQNLLGIFSVLMIAMENHYTSIFASYTVKPKKLKKELLKVYSENYKKIIFLFLLAIPIGLLFYNQVYQEKYGSAYIVFFGFLLVQFILVALKPISIALKSLERTKIFFIGHIVAVCAVVIGISLLNFYQVNHTLVISYVLANIIYVWCILYFYLKKLQF